MKKSTLTLVTMITLICSVLATPTNNINRCRIEMMDKDTYASIINRNEEDLLSGIWTSNTLMGSGESQTLLFDKSGIVMILSSSFDNGISVSQKNWKVMDFDGKAFLVMSEISKSKEELYQLNQTCEGIELVNVATGKVLKFNYNAINIENDKTKLAKQLVGKWESTNYPFEIAKNFNQCGSFIPVNGAFFSIELKEDGSFKRTFGGELQKYNQTGTWEVSKDGKYLVFKTTHQNGIKLKSHSLDGMEIERFNGNKLHAKAALSTKDNTTIFCTNTKTFSFTR